MNNLCSWLHQPGPFPHGGIFYVLTVRALLPTVPLGARMSFATVSKEGSIVSKKPYQNAASANKLPLQVKEVPKTIVS